jgi:sialate O-acetylesterase
MKIIPSFPQHRFRLLLALSVIGSSVGMEAVEAALSPAPVFGDHMVLQRDKRVPVWGTADAGAHITVTFGRSSAKGVAAADGTWRVEIGPFPASASPANLKIISNKGDQREIKDVLVGEVWVGSGQSNMQLASANFIGNPNNPQVSTVADKNLEALIDGAPYPQVRLFAAAMNNKPVPAADMKWTPATQETLKTFSAQLGTMGVTLSRKLDVPVGLMLAAIGGSPSSRWLTPQAIAEDHACQEVLAQARAKFSMEKEQAAYQEALKKYESEQAAWSRLSDAEKKTRKAPGKPSPPVVPGTGNRWPVGDLHEQVLKPLIGYGIRGVFWDQGESGAFIRGIDQFTLMGALFASWRKEWGQGEFPFVIVQKPSGGGSAFDANDPVYGWASDKFQPLPPSPPGDGKGREEMIRIAAAYPNVFLVPTSDLGGGLHPVNKFAYGTRAARVIHGAIYGKPGAWNGPTLEETQVQGDKIRVRFRHVGQGLVARHTDALQGFAIAGADKKFVWAQAVIDGDAVVVSAPSIPKPLYVRYAWANSIPWANLFNKDGFPALSFRTDP